MGTRYIVLMALSLTYAMDMRAEQASLVFLRKYSVQDTGHYCYNTSSPKGHSATATMINSHYILVSKWQLQLLHCVTACYACTTTKKPIGCCYSDAKQPLQY